MIEGMRQLAINDNYRSAQSNLQQVGLVAGASWPPTAYRKPLHVATPTPPRRFDIGVHGIHLLVWGSKHSTDLRHEDPSRPPTEYNLDNRTMKKMYENKGWDNIFKYSKIGQQNNEDKPWKYVCQVQPGQRKQSRKCISKRCSTKKMLQTKQTGHCVEMACTNNLHNTTHKDQDVMNF